MSALRSKERFDATFCAGIIKTEKKEIETTEK